MIKSLYRTPPSLFPSITLADPVSREVIWSHLLKAAHHVVHIEKIPENNEGTKENLIILPLSMIDNESLCRV
jgi:hypothetical protein